MISLPRYLFIKKKKIVSRDIHSILLAQSNINPRRASGGSLLIYISIGCCGYSGKVLIIFLATATHPAVTIAGKKSPQSSQEIANVSPLRPISPGHEN